MTWNEYRARFVTERRVTRGVEVSRDQAGALDEGGGEAACRRTSSGIVGVETAYGENVGKHRVLDALSTLAFDYPPRSEFFRGELEQYLLMTREESLDPLAPIGSYAGAMGIPQFMPSSFTAGRSTATATCVATSGTTGTTSSPASPTTSRRTAGRPANL